MRLALSQLKTCSVAEQEEEKEPEDDPAPWLDNSQEHIISYDDWVTKCTHKDKDGRKRMICRACNKALKCDNDTGLCNHHMALNCCPPKVLGQCAKEWSLKQKRSKTAKGQRGSPTSRDALLRPRKERASNTFK